MSDLVEIGDARARVVVAPGVGAALVRYDLLTDDGPLALLRAPADDVATEPFALASNVLVPWSNRISGGGFWFDGEFHALEPNLPGEALPIHGNGLQMPWRVVGEAADRVDLAVASDGPGPFRYDAMVRYALADGVLTMALTVTNRARRPLPYGFGFHPWLPRTAAMTLAAPADRVWLEDERHLPTEVMAVQERPAWDFAAAKGLPADWINNAFAGWSGSARVAWPETGAALTITASENLSTYIVYSPNADADFFCFEPVSHPVDAHNLDDAPGLLRLADGEAAAGWCTLAPSMDGA